MVGITSSATVVSDLLRTQHIRASDAIVLNVMRARVLADARESTRAFCSGAERVVFNIEDTGGNPLFVTEYSVEEGKLVRWRTPPDKSFVLADEAQTLDCTSLGGEGTEVSVLLGKASSPSHFYFMVGELPEESS